MKDKLVEIIATELIGVLPVYKGPFVSDAQARRVANYHNLKRYEIAGQMAIFIMKEYEEQIKIELTEFLSYLLKNNYCDSDVYDEPPTAIDGYLELKRKKR